MSMTNEQVAQIIAHEMKFLSFDYMDVGIAVTLARSGDRMTTDHIARELNIDSSSNDYMVLRNTIEDLHDMGHVELVMINSTAEPRWQLDPTLKGIVMGKIGGLV